MAPGDLANRCLFCHFRGESFEEVLAHSRKQHSFFFLGSPVTPDEDNCVDPRGLFEGHLAERVFLEHKCIFCGGTSAFLIPDELSEQRFANWDAAQRHMRDVGHCKMRPEAIDSVEAYYDYSAENLAFLQRKFDRLEIKTKTEIAGGVPDAICENDEDEWEDCDSGDEAGPAPGAGSEETGAPGADEQYVLIRGFWHPLQDKIVSSSFIREHLRTNDKDEAVLPGGKILGHRKFAKYYRQNVTQSVLRKSELVRAIAFREAERRGPGGELAKYNATVKALERCADQTFAEGPAKALQPPRAHFAQEKANANEKGAAQARPGEPAAPAAPAEVAGPQGQEPQPAGLAALRGPELCNQRVTAAQLGLVLVPLRDFVSAFRAVHFLEPGQSTPPWRTLRPKTWPRPRRRFSCGASSSCPFSS